MEYTGDMIDRIEEMDQAVYKMCLAFLQLNDADDLEVKFPWSSDIIEEIYGAAVQTLRKYQYKVCDPYVEHTGGSSQYCNIKTCGIRECKLHP